MRCNFCVIMPNYQHPISMHMPILITLSFVKVISLRQKQAFSEDGDMSEMRRRNEQLTEKLDLMEKEMARRLASKQVHCTPWIQCRNFYFCFSIIMQI